MAVSPTKLSAAQLGNGPAKAPPEDWAFLVSEANSSRSRDTITLIQRDAPWYAGSFVKHDGTAPVAVTDISGILCASTSTKYGPRAVTIISRDAEVRDAYLIYGALTPKQVCDHLESHGIIVREAVLSNVAPGAFSNAPVLPADIVSGRPPQNPPVLTYPQSASFAPSTLEAAESDKPAAGSPQPAPATVPVLAEGEQQPPPDGSQSPPETPTAPPVTPTPHA